jgi:hypothetical protein
MVERDDETDLEVARSASHAAVREFERFLKREGKTRHELLLGILRWGHNPNAIEPLEERIRAEGPMQEVASGKLEALTSSVLVKEFVDRVGTLDGVSKLLVGSYDPDDEGTHYEIYNPAIWLWGLEGPRKSGGAPMMGQFGHIGGRKLGRGKTSWGASLAKIAVERGHHVLTNIRFKALPEDAAPLVHRITRLSDLIRQAIAVKRQGKCSIAIVDESLFVFGRQDAMTKEWRDFDKFVRWVRKLHMSLVFITHNFDLDVPEKFKPFVTTRFEKPALKQLDVRITSDNFHFTKHLRGAPKPEWECDDESRGGLDVDVDIQALHDHLTQNAAVEDVDEDELTLRFLGEQAAARGAPGMAPERSRMEERVAIILANPSDYQDAKGALDLAAIMTRFGISRSTAADIAQIVNRRRANPIS